MLVCAALPTGSNKYIIIRLLLYYYNFGLQKLPLPIKDDEGLCFLFVSSGPAIYKQPASTNL
jgi:hypothetical protein